MCLASSIRESEITTIEAIGATVTGAEILKHCTKAI
jgi:hypothetical protein